MDATDSIRILLQAILLPRASKFQQITPWGFMVNQSEQSIDKDTCIGTSRVSGGLFLLPNFRLEESSLFSCYGYPTAKEIFACSV